MHLRIIFSTAINSGISVLAALFGYKLGNATNISRAGSAIKSASGISSEAGDIRAAEEQYTALQELEDLNTTVETEGQKIADSLDTDLMTFGSMELWPSQNRHDCRTRRLAVAALCG